MSGNNISIHQPEDENMSSGNKPPVAVAPSHRLKLTRDMNKFDHLTTDNGGARITRGNSLYSRTLEWSKESSTGSKGRKLFGPQPNNKFGPKAKLGGLSETIYEEDGPQKGMVDPTTQRLEWKAPPKNVLIIKKIYDPTITSHFVSLARWLIKEKNMTVYVEEGVKNDCDLLSSDEDFSQSYVPHLQVFVSKADAGCKKEEDMVDLVVCLGGDGTLIHVSSLFQDCCPPVIAFHLGSLGFLTHYSITTYAEDIAGVLAEQVGISLRSRLKCQVRALNDEGEDEIQFEYLVLNEVTFDRGQTSQVANMDIYCNGRHLTALIGDGLIISTPTGSTAYSMSAGASLVHPSVPGIILTPLCPHSLSFRPIVLPAGVELKIMVATESRNREPMCAFDGRHMKVLDETRYLRVTTSIYPIPCVSREDHLSDWFNSLAECLNWNRRESKRIASSKSPTAKTFPNGNEKL